MTEYNLPVPDDLPYLNLTQEEVEELRNKKYELTEYGKQRLREMMTHEEMLEEAERREKLNAGLKQDADGNWYRPTLQELTRNERIELAEKEVAYIVMGGQDGREYANSIAFILQVLDSLRDKESDFEDSANGVA
jgi:hypothetical protein